MLFTQYGPSRLKVIMSKRKGGSSGGYRKQTYVSKVRCKLFAFTTPICGMFLRKMLYRYHFDNDPEEF